MPAPHACMPLFTTWYALIPGIILFVTGGIRPYAPRQFGQMVYELSHSICFNLTTTFLHSNTLVVY
jgi:hypothetical protein